MLKESTYRGKVIYLLIAFLIILLLALLFPVKKTLVSKRECNNLEDRLSLAKDAPLQIFQYETRLGQLEKIIGKSYSEGQDLEQMLLAKVSEYCSKNKITLIEFPGTHNFKHPNYFIETNTIVVQGSFIKLLKLLHILESKYLYGKVISTHFVTEKNFRTGRKKLFLNIYIQNIKNLNDEN